MPHAFHLDTPVRLPSTMARLHLDERRAQLLALGVELFTLKPYEEVSIEEIATEAGISKGLLYHYFGGKRSFYAASLEEAARQLLVAVLDDEALPEHGPDRLRAGLERYVDWVDERTEAYMALMHGGTGRVPEVVAILEKTRRRLIEDLLARIGLDTPRPGFRLAGRAWLGAVEAAAKDWLAFRDVSRDQLVELLMVNLGATLMVASLHDPDAPVEIDLSELGTFFARATVSG